MTAIVARLIVAAVVFALALDGGTFGLVSRSSLAIVVWWTIGLTVALGVLPLSRIPPAGLITGGLLTAFVAWTGASIAWSTSAERAFNEFNRAALYLGIFVAAVLVARGDTARRWSDGAALGIAAVGLLALGSRLFPDAFPSDAVDPYVASPQLRYPLHYSNGLGIFIGLAVPLLLRPAVFAERALWRALAVATLPPLAAVLYLTSSRGGVAAAVIGTACFLALTTRRWEAASVVGLGCLASSAVVAFVATQSALVDRPETADAASQGGTSAAVITLVCVATVGVYWAGERMLRGRQAPAPSVGWAVVAAALVLAAAGVAATDPAERFESFKQPPERGASESYSVRGHLLSVTSSGRWQFWRAAVDQFEAEPMVGGGAGSYEAWWAEHGSVAMFIVDAHSLYFETAGELGLVGLLLLLGAFTTGWTAAVLALLRSRGPGPETLAALAACFAAYALGAGLDWMWELTVVSAVGFACLGFLAHSPAWADGGQTQAGLSLPGRVVVPIASAVLIALQASSLLSSISIRESEAAVRSGDTIAAREAADDARALQPWASSPYLQLALVEEERGRLQPAFAAVSEAIQRDRDDWRLWLVRARIETKTGRIAHARRSLARATMLNPRSPLFADASQPNGDDGSEPKR